MNERRTDIEQVARDYLLGLSPLDRARAVEELIRIAPAAAADPAAQPGVEPWDPYDHDVRGGHTTLYVVEALPHQQRGLVRDLVSPHVLVRRVTRHDRVVATLLVRWSVRADAAGDVLVVRVPTGTYDPELGEQVGVALAGQPDLLAEVAVEIAESDGGRLGEIRWDLAPCTAQIDPDADDAHSGRTVHLRHVVAIASEGQFGDRTEALSPAAWRAAGYGAQADEHGMHYLGTTDRATWGRPVHVWLPCEAPAGW